MTEAPEARRAPKSVSHYDRTKQFGRAMPKGLSPQAKLTAVYLFTHALDDGTGIYCSVETLMEMTGFTRRTQFRALKELIDAEYLIEDGWKVYSNQIKTRRRRLDLDRMAAVRSDEDAQEHSAISGTVGGDDHSATSGTVAGGGTVPEQGGHSARFGGGTVPYLAPKPSLNLPIEPPQHARARAHAREDAASDQDDVLTDLAPGSAFDALFGTDPPAPPAPPDAGHARAAGDPSGDPHRWMPRLADPEHRWSSLAPGEEIDPRSMTGQRKQIRSGWFLKDIALLVADAVGWHDQRRYIDWRPLCAWLDDGIDPHDVILPTIRRIMERRGNLEISTLGYFDRAVREGAAGGRRMAG